MFTKFFNKRHSRGFTLVELIVSLGLGGILTLILASQLKVQTEENIDYNILMARFDVEKRLLNFMNKKDLCSFVLNDNSQSSIASPPNRSVDVIDTTLITTANPAVINLNKLPLKAASNSPTLISVNGLASSLSRKLLVNEIKFSIRPSIPPDLYVADLEVNFNQPLSKGKVRNVVLQNIPLKTDPSTPPNAKKIAQCAGIGNPTPERFVFTSSATWTVPLWVDRIFVTMAGGGGSGLGWKFLSHIQAGHSGGYVFAVPITVTPGEVLQVIVGKGGVGYGAVRTTIHAIAQPQYYIHIKPTGDDGLGGYPGESTKLISLSKGRLLLECAGGSGAQAGGYDFFSSTFGDNKTVASNEAAAFWVSVPAAHPTPKRDALGPYATPGGPGRCGPSSNPAFGRGQLGTSVFADLPDEPLRSGVYVGGLSPLGYGSGGDVTSSGCYTAQTSGSTSRCQFVNNGNDGVVFIDI